MRPRTSPVTCLAGTFPQIQCCGRLPPWIAVLTCLALFLASPAATENSGLVADDLGQAAGSPDDNKPLRPGMDRFDMRAAEEPVQSEKLSLIIKSFERQRWDEGAQKLQELLNEEHDSLTFGEDHLWRPTSEVALDLIRRFPEDAKTSYVLRYGPHAERDLPIARRNRDISSLLQISRRYLFTTAGQQATRDLIDAAIDHGNTDAVARLVSLLLRVDSPVLQDDVWRNRVTAILQQSGYTKLVAQLNQLPETSQDSPTASDVWAFDTLRVTDVPTREWTSLSGSSRGQTVADIEEPTALPRWRQPLVTSHRVREMIEDFAYSTEMQGVMGLSVLSTIGVGDVLVTRTLGNLMALDMNTGKILWTSHDGGPTSSEREDVEYPAYFGAIEALDLQARLRHLLTASASLGTLSANSRHVFSLAGSELGDSALESIMKAIEPDLDETHDQARYLYARDLKTGRIAWRAGGPPSEEPPGLPAAGVSFFGPPTADGDELFGVGERDGDVFLFCIEAETGIIRWEQLLATTGRRLTEDYVRRSWTAPVAVRGSTVICPTTTGWVTAVDRMTRRIIWSQRLVERVAAGSDSSSGDLTFDAPNREMGLDERWPPLQPIILRDRVLIAPIELPDETGATLPRLLCYDLLTGNKLWEIAKNQLVGVVGASEELVYLFDQRSIQAFRCDTGAQAWICSLAGETLAGRPVLTNDGIYVPLQSSSFVRIDTATGKAARRIPLDRDASDQRRLLPLISPEYPRPLSLGNLIVIDERLISVSPTEIAAMTWHSEELKWQTESRTYAESAISWAKSLALEGQFEDAVREVRNALPLLAENAPTLPQVRRLLGLFLLLHAESQRTEAHPDSRWKDWLKEARTILSDPASLESIQRLEIELSIRSGEWDDAWRLIQAAIRQPLGQRIDIGGRIVSADAWLADQILELARIPDRERGDAMRDSIRKEFLTLWKDAATDAGTQTRLLQLFAESDFTDASELESLINNGPPPPLHMLEALTHSRDQNTALRASLKLIEALATPDWVGEARRRIRQLPDVAQWPVDLQPVRTQLEQLLGSIHDSHSQPTPSWHGTRMEVTRLMGGDFESPVNLPIHWISSPCEALENFHYTYDNDRETLIIERRDGSLYCELPLFNGVIDIEGPRFPVLYGVGFNLYLVHTGMVHAFSIPEKRLLWKRIVSMSDGSDPRRYRFDSHPGLLNHSSAFSNQIERHSDYYLATSFETANSRHIVIRSRRGIEVLCALTGQLLWEIPQCPHEIVRSDRHHLIRFSGNRVRGFSIHTGRPLSVRSTSEFLSTMLPLDEFGITTLTEMPGESENFELQGYRIRGETIVGRDEAARDYWDEGDQLQFKPTWRLPVGSRSFLGAGPAGQGLWLNESGDLQQIDWTTGRPIMLAKSVIDRLTQTDDEARNLRIHGLWDRFQVYLSTDSTLNTKSIDCQAVPIQGQAMAISREKAELAWRMPFDGFLLMDSFDRGPNLAMIQTESAFVADIPYQKVHLWLIDKTTGKVVQDLNVRSHGMGIAGCRFHPVTQLWQLFLQQETIQVRRKASKPH